MLGETDEYREKIARTLFDINRPTLDELFEAHGILLEGKTKSDYYWAADQILSLFPAITSTQAGRRLIIKRTKTNRPQ